MSVAVTSVAQDLATSLPEYLRQYKFSKRDLQAVERGEAAVKLIDAEHDSETQLLGVVKIQGRPAEFISRYRDIVNFEKGTGILQNGLFSNPPQISDLDGLSLDAEDFEDLKDCKPGDCDIKLSGRAIHAFQQFDWDAKDSAPKAEQLARQMIVDFLKAYQEGGNVALATLHDKRKPVPAGRDFEEMIQSPDLPAYFPELYSFLNDYPEARLPGAEEIFYWSKVDFGLKPVIRLNHIVIYGPTNITSVKYAVASKMLYASHYFNTGIEMKFLVERSDSPDAFYLVSNNRSRSDGFTGFIGFFVGRTIRRRARSSLESYLTSIKRKLEEHGTKTVESSNAHD